MALEHLTTWSGSKSEFVILCNSYLRDLHIGDPNFTATEDLVEEYRRLGITVTNSDTTGGSELTFENLIQFLACRSLLNLGWFLPNISEVIKKSLIEDLLKIVPECDIEAIMGAYGEQGASENIPSPVQPEFDRKLLEAHTELNDQILENSNNEQIFQSQVFFEEYAGLASEAGDVNDLTHTEIGFEGAKPYNVDGYSFDMMTGELILVNLDYENTV